MALVLLFLAGFAYGLRWIDQRLAPTPDRTEPSPVRELPASFSEQLSEGVRFIFGVPTAHAAEFDANRYKAEPASRAVTVTAAPGGTASVEIRFKNLGSAVWSPEGRGFVSAYTTQPRYHAGVLRHASWLSASQPAKLATARVAPGETGVVKFLVQAPAKEGTYSDWIQLAAEDTAWIYGGHVQVILNVKKGAQTAFAAPTPAGAAVLLLKSAQKITAAADMAVAFKAGFKNNGTSAWTTRALVLKDGPAVTHASWSDAATPVRTAVDVIAPGQIGFLDFVMTTPKKRGDYTVKLALAANGSEIPEALLEIPITVTNDALDQSPAPQVPGTSVPGTPVPGTLVPGEGVEPMLRVGLYTTEKFEEISFDGPFEARDTSGGLVGSFPAGAHMQFWYDAPAALYRVTNGVVNFASARPIRFVPLNPNDIFTLWSHQDRPSWNASINYNRFRGTLEMRKNDRNAYVWVIDELPMEQYLKGMKETSNASPLEFQKALVVAARTYADWHLTHPGKHWHFNVDAEYDQVYKGYVAETQNPKLTLAADATRGQAVFYAGELAVTPYFSWSDGRTRAWTEVWGGGAKPWLVSVSAPHDVGRTLYGHGVGMSAWDAIGMANDGAAYDAILKHYYTGTELRRLY